jgi:hypothetical protein
MAKDAIPPGWMGYPFGIGKVVEQAGSRTTAVTVDAYCGQITLVSAAGSTTAASFTVNNAMVGADDVVVACVKSGTDPRRVNVVAVADGSFVISTATISGTTTEQPVISFMVFKNDVN